MPRFLFIGGQNNGRRFETGGESFVRLQVPKSHAFDDNNPYIECEVYRMQTIRGQTCDFYVYIHESLTIDDAMNILLKNFPDPGQKQRRDL